jgi:hypothetical protein
VDLNILEKEVVEGEKTGVDISITERDSSRREYRPWSLSIEKIKCSFRGFKSQMDGFITGFFFRVSLYFLVCLLRMEDARKKGLGMKRRKLGNQIVLVFEFSLAFCAENLPCFLARKWRWVGF